MTQTHLIAPAAAEKAAAGTPEKTTQQTAPDAAISGGARRFCVL